MTIRSSTSIELEVLREELLVLREDITSLETLVGSIIQYLKTLQEAITRMDEPLDNV